MVISIRCDEFFFTPVDSLYSDTNRWVKFGDCVNQKKKCLSKQMEDIIVKV